MAQEEHVLVVPRDTFAEVGLFHGLTFNVESYLSRIFAPGAASFMPRSKAETDPTYKQIIPYVILTCDGRYLSYVRGKQAGEKRLVGSRSIGIGGHVNPADDMPLFGGDTKEAYLTAVKREVAEEVTIQGPYADRVVALLNDDSTEVGQVHLGVVHLWSLTSPQVQKGEKMITQLGFHTAAELRALRDEMESWSQFCLDHLADFSRPSKSGLSPMGVRDL